jgi:hypothetical protein
MPTLIGFALMMLVRYVIARKRGTKFAPFSAYTQPFSRSLRALLWFGVSSFAVILEIVLLAGAVGSHGELGLGLAAAAGAAILASWWMSGRWLLALARRPGAPPPRLMYILAQLLSVFSLTDESSAGAVLVAAVRIAHARPATAEERAWLWSKIRRQKRGFGTLACAAAVLLLLDARAARDEGRLAAAREALLQARGLLGTVSYAGSKGAPRLVRRLAGDLHALVSAELGDWGFVAIAEEQWLSDDVKQLRAVVIEHMGDPRAGLPPVPQPPRSILARIPRRPRPPSPLAVAMQARLADAPDGPVTLPFEEAQTQARAVHAALSRGEPVAVHEQFLVLAVFDTLLTPQAPMTVIPEIMRADTDAVAAMQEDVAQGLSGLLVDLPPPFAALRSYGPVSARVHRTIESRLLGDLQATCDRANRRVKDRWRGTPYEEWLEATNLRQAFRRLEHTLGTPAAVQAWPLYSAAAGRLGVSFSETRPRRRPLAHCIFHSLYKDAQRFDDPANVKQQGHNMRVTS